MIVAELPQLDLDVQHLVMSGVSWEFYERLLAEIGDGTLRVTYDDGELEIMSPLPMHERWGWRIARLIDTMGMERRLVIEAFGSTTFRREDRRKDLEPDKCYYVQHAAEASDLNEAFDAASEPPPDLAIEIDITRRSVGREPVYAALGVPELWRFAGRRLTVRLLSAEGTYVTSDKSLAFPFLPMAEFERFVLRVSDEPQLNVLDDFRPWLRGL